MPNKKNPSSNKEPTPKQDLSDPWISRRSGLRLTAITSVVVAVWMYFQGGSEVAFGEKLLWAVVFGVNVWVVFGLVLLMNRYLRGK